MPISCHMRDLGFSDSEAPAAKGPTPKPTHIEHFSSLAAHRKVRGRGGRGGAAGRGAEGAAATLGHCRGGAALNAVRCGGVLRIEGCGADGAERMVRVPARRMMRAAAFCAAARLRRWRD